MSSGTTKHQAIMAKAIAHDVVGMLNFSCERITIAGSLRRGRPLVGDVEIVAIPRYEGALNLLLNRLDHLVLAGTVRKAWYAGKDGKMNHRWGEKYRGIDYRGMKIEVFTADPDNWGYIEWLRTGPGDANKYVMSRVMYGDAPYRASDSDWWAGQRRIIVPDEVEMFRLLGMAYVEPANRTEETYRKGMQSAKWAAVDSLTFADDVPVLQQSGLF
jgi:DNA polymerase/3'-5' exonuclease PolX